MNHFDGSYIPLAIFPNVWEGPDDTLAGGDDDDTLSGGDNGDETLDEKKFSQRDVNRMNAQHKRRLVEENKKLAAKLESLLKNQSLSDEERESLTKSYEELRSQYETETEKAKRERLKLEKGYSTQIEQLTQDRDSWKNRFHEATLNRALVDAAIASNPWNPDQVVAILRPKARLAEKVDADGNPTGDFEVRVNYDGTSSDGKPVTLNLTVSEAVKQMKDEPERYGNLFKTEGSGGLGFVNHSPKNGKVDYKNMTYDQYKSEVRPSLMGEKK